MGNMTGEEESFSNLLELAANDDLPVFKSAVAADPAAADQPGLWYARNKVTNRMVLEHRTPLMVAATYGSTNVLRYLLSLPSVDVNARCGPESTTALHCAASGGSHKAVESVRLLLSAGADVNVTDSKLRRASDVIAVPTLYSDAKSTLQNLLGLTPSNNQLRSGDLKLSICTSVSTSPPLSSSSPDEDSPSSDLSSPMANHQKKEYPIDPTLPDIKSSIYASDEFRMYSFKVRPCSRAYSHDWTECPFVHPGENARRRDPRKFHYSCVPCPDFRRGGACRRADMCEYAHGVFESWLHPAQYRTRLCKDGTGCDRRVCFFAHTAEELRPLYVATGSAVPSPRSVVAMEMAAVALGLVPPGSPSSVNNGHGHGHFMPPGSPSWANNNNGGNNSNLQASRLRASLSARDMPVDELSLILDLEKMNDLCLNSPNPKNNIGGLSSPMAGNINTRVNNKQFGQANLEDLFNSEMSLSSLSPRFNNASEQQGNNNFFSPAHKSAVLNHRLLSPINTSNLSVSTGFNVPAGMSPPGRNSMSARTIEALASPMSSRLAALAQRTGGGASLAGGNSNSASVWAKMGSPLSKVDWSVHGGLGADEPDVSWVNSLVSPPENKERNEREIRSNGPDLRDQNDRTDGMDQIGAWLEQMQ
ncbi:hypothetical protein LUZ60_005458 [Juncus effusus]|nr:hypothetical protein LUZ60_005458 [Juncus effusus]